MRTLGKTLVAIAVILGAARLALPSVIRTQLNRRLAELPGGYAGSVGDVDLALLRGAVALRDAELHDARRDLVIDAPALRLDASVPELLRGRLALRAEVERPTVRAAVRRAVRRAKKELAKRQREKKAKAARGEAEPPPKPLPDLLAALMPFRVERLELRDGAVVVSEGGVEARVTGIRVVLEDLTNQEGGRSARLSARARVLEKGELSATVRADPLAKSPTFDARLEVKEVDLPSLNPVLRWQMGVDVERGAFTLVSEMRAEGGGFEGYVKPQVRDLELLGSDDADKPLRAVKEAVAGAVSAVLRNPRTRKVAAKIPVKGRFEDPEIGVWSAVLSVFRNAFVEALEPSFEGI